jgi:hypothetical protein
MRMCLSRPFRPRSGDSLARYGWSRWSGVTRRCAGRWNLVRRRLGTKVPGFVPLPRLVEAVSGGLALVCAPAGFGKTALLADWAQAGGRPVGWLHRGTLVPGGLRKIPPARAPWSDAQPGCPLVTSWQNRSSGGAGLPVSPLPTATAEELTDREAHSDPQGEDSAGAPLGRGPARRPPGPRCGPCQGPGPGQRLTRAGRPCRPRPAKTGGLTMSGSSRSSSAAQVANPLISRPLRITR